MSWREADSNEFNRHGGRNAFRNTDDADPSPTERAATLRAMRSFTESIDCDVPPVPELPPELDIDRVEGLKTSDTNDTIIEVAHRGVDPSLGETQKYKMAVPGPGHSEQEQELHKSLIRDEEDEADLEVEQAMATVPSSVEGASSSTSQRNVPDSDHTALRREYSNVAVQRRRPTTPTSSCVVESLAFVGGETEVKESAQKGEKIKVSIPSSRRRKGDMDYYEFIGNMSSQMPYQARRGSVSGRTTPLNDYEGDILEENPQYKDKAPPKPVVHRRISMEWENFEDRKEAMDVDQPPPKKPQRSHIQADDDEEPTFSEDMREERDKLRRERKATKSSPSAEAPAQSSRNADEAKEEPKVVAQEQTNVIVHKEAPEVSADEEPKEEVASGSAQVSEHQEHQGHQEHHEHHEGAEQDYDPHAYPGYIWNYEKQEWEVDPNYDASQHETYDQSGAEANHDTQNYDYSSSGYQEQGQYSYKEGDQVQQGYEQQGEAYDQYHAGYDQGTEAQAPNEYDYTTSAFHSGYDQNGQEGYTAPTEYSYTTAAYHVGYDQNGEHTGYTEGTAEYSQEYDHQGQYSQEYNQEQYHQDQQGTQEYNYQHEYYSGYNGEAQDGSYAQGYDYSQQEYQEGYGHQEHYNTNGNYSQYDERYSAQAAAGLAEEVNHGQTTAMEYSEREESIPHRPPVPTNPFATPLFPSAPATKDPYAWEGEAEAESAVQPQAAAVSPTPPVPPPPSRPAPPPTPKEEIAPAYAAPPPRPPPAARPPPPRPTAPQPAKPAPPPQEPEEEDPWARFKAMTEKVNKDLQKTSALMEDLKETTAAKEIKDESYLATVGGEQGFTDSIAQREIQKKIDQQKEAKQLKKKLKQQGKKAASPTFDPDEEDNMDKAAQELAAKLAAKMNMENFKPSLKQHDDVKREDSMSAIPPRKRSSLKDTQQDSGGSLELPPHLSSQQRDSIAPKGDLDPDDPVLAAPAWADFDTSEPVLPPSESGFFSKKPSDSTGETMADPFTCAGGGDPFAPTDKALIEENYDPFAIQSADDIMAAAKAKAEEAKQRLEGRDDVDFFDAGRQSPDSSSPTPEGGSPVSHRPTGFEDDFKCEGVDGETPTPLYDEDDSIPLPDFQPKFSGEGWQLMIRHPIKKKSFMAERCWKPCFVRLRDHTLYVYNSRDDPKPIQELLLQATYSLSDTTLQAYDIYGKIHTVKLQYVIYKEKVGIRPGQISRLVEGHVTKYGLPLEHSAQCNVLLKFGSLDASELQSFVTTVEDILFQCPAKRDTKPIYKQDEVQVHCYDEYTAFVDKDGLLSDQRARVRLFCLAFVTGSPVLEIGLNDRRRQGKEIVRRKDILPMYTERWIRFENLEFHSTVERPSFEREQVIRLSPPDGCFFEVMRFRVRPPRNREKALNVKCIMKIAGSKVEIRMECMAAAQLEKSKGGKSTRRQIPCEDIAIRFPIPEAWIYIFREERHWGVGSVHSKKLRPGKVKNLKDRLLGAVQSNEPNLIEVAIGEAKYEHVYRSLVWRIPRLPEKHHAAYKAHLLKCRFELSSFDLMPETFLPRCEVDFTMPLATVSNTVVRSVSVEQHEDSDRVEKFVRYVAKCQYKVEIDYVQCADLDVDTSDPSANPELTMAAVPDLHQPSFHPDNVQDMHEGYRIDFPERPPQMHDDSSSDDDDDKQHKMPIIQIDMKNYGY